MTRTASTLLAACLTAAPVAAQEPTGVTFPSARIAYFDAQRVATESTAGRTAFAELETFQTTFSARLEERNQTLAAERRRLETEASLLSATARLDLEQRIQRTQLDLERMVEDAQAQFVGLQRQLDAGFQATLMPVVAEIVDETGVHFLFERMSTPIVWIDPAYDLTERIIERLDAN